MRRKRWAEPAPPHAGVCGITADYKDNEKTLAAFIQDKMVQWCLEAGAIATERAPIGTMGPTTHAYGGTRMGDNPETNVVDRWGFSTMRRTSALGASVMGTSGAQPDLDGAGARVANGRTSGEELEDDRSLAQGVFV